MASYIGFLVYLTSDTQLVPKSLEASFNKEWREVAAPQSDAEQECLPLRCLRGFYHYEES